MSLDFPSSPTNGQEYSSGGKTWVYSTTTTSWELKTSASYLGTTGGTITGNLNVTGSTTIQSLGATSGTFSSGITVTSGATSIQSLSATSGTFTSGLSVTSGTSTIQGLSATSGSFSSGLSVTSGTSTIQGLSATSGSFSSGLSVTSGSTTLQGMSATSGSFSSGLSVTAGTTSIQGTLVIPTGTTAQRPTGAIGIIRYNTDTAVYEGYTPDGWTELSSANIARLSWNKTTDTYTGEVNLDVHSRIRRCVLQNGGTVNYYLDADDSTKKAGDWLRIVETQTISTEYSGTHTETSNTRLRQGVSQWTAGTYSRGTRVIYNGSLWECIVNSTTTTPAAGTVASDLSGADGQVMTEIPRFSVRYNYIGTTHNWELRRGTYVNDGWSVHPAFIKSDNSYRDYIYIGAYQVTGTSPATTVSGVSNRVNMSRSTLRTDAAARGSGWHQWSHYELAAVQYLIITEFQNLNSQKRLGNGAQDGGTYVVNTGLSNSVGNKSQNIYTGGGANTDYISYRGMENLYGRAWQWTDGINANGTSIYLNRVYSTFADDTSTNYTLVGTIASGSSAFQTNFLALSEVFLPSEASGGGGTSFIADPVWTNTGWRVSLVGGASDGGSAVGIFSLYLDSSSGGTFTSFGGRIAYGTP